MQRAQNKGLHIWSVMIIFYESIIPVWFKRVLGDVPKSMSIKNNIISKIIFPPTIH